MTDEIKLVNINYKGFTNENIENLPFNKWKPRQYVCKYPNYSIIIFKSGKCRIMGCKKPITDEMLPFSIKILKIQSLTVTFDLKIFIDFYNIQQIQDIKKYITSFCKHSNKDNFI